MMDTIGLLSEKQFLILASMDGSFISEVCKKTDITYSHAVNVRNLFTKYGFVTTEKRGRLVMLKLTPDGRKLLDLYQRIRMLMKLK